MEKLKNTVHQQNLINIYRMLHTTAQCTFVLSAHRTYTKTDYILGHKIKLNELKRNYTECVP